MEFLKKFFRKNNPIDYKAKIKKLEKEKNALSMKIDEATTESNSLAAKLKDIKEQLRQANKTIDNLIYDREYLNNQLNVLNVSYPALEKDYLKKEAKYEELEECFYAIIDIVKSDKKLNS